MRGLSPRAHAPHETNGFLFSPPGRGMRIVWVCRTHDPDSAARRISLRAGAQRDAATAIQQEDRSTRNSVIAGHHILLGAPEGQSICRVIPMGRGVADRAWKSAETGDAMPLVISTREGILPADPAVPAAALRGEQDPRAQKIEEPATSRVPYSYKSVVQMRGLGGNSTGHCMSVTDVSPWGRKHRFSSIVYVCSQ